jgi:hypothetical protein
LQATATTIAISKLSTAAESSTATASAPSSPQAAAPSTLMIRQQQPFVTLEILLASITVDPEYPSDVRDFVDNPPIGQKLI